MVTIFLIASFVFTVWIAIEIGNSRPWWWVGRWPPPEKKKPKRRESFHSHRWDSKKTENKNLSSNLNIKNISDQIAPKKTSSKMNRSFRIIENVKFQSNRVNQFENKLDCEILNSFIAWSKKFNELSLYNKYQAALKYEKLFTTYYIRDHSLITNEYLSNHESNICCFRNVDPIEQQIPCNLLWDWLRRIPRKANIGKNLFEINHQIVTDITDRTFEEFIKECVEDPDLFKLFTSTEQVENYWNS